MDKSNRETLRAHYGKPENEKFSRLLVGRKGILEIQVLATGAVVKANRDEHTLTHLISTPRIDYVRDVMDPFGVKATALQKNRGVFWNHAWGSSGHAGLPIAMNLTLQPEKRGVVASTKFAVGLTESKFPEDCYNLAEAGFLNSWSIGFFPVKYRVGQLKDVAAEIGDRFEIANAGEFTPETEVIWHQTWDLHEYSLVGIPMNQDAVNMSGLQEALEKGLIVSDIGLKVFGALAGGRAKITVSSLPGEEGAAEGSAQADPPPAGETGDEVPPEPTKKPEEGQPEDPPAAEGQAGAGEGFDPEELAAYYEQAEAMFPVIAEAAARAAENHQKLVDELTKVAASLAEILTELENLRGDRNRLEAVDAKLDQVVAVIEDFLEVDGKPGEPAAVHEAPGTVPEDPDKGNSGKPKAVDVGALVERAVVRAGKIVREQ